MVLLATPWILQRRAHRRDADEGDEIRRGVGDERQ
jgi:hypothetical protein